MDLNTESLGAATVVRCAGRLNMVAAPAVRAELEQLVEDGRRHLVVDLSSTSFIDSSGLGALISGLKRARQAGGDLRLAGPNEQVRTVLSLTNLDRVLKPYDDVGAAADGW
jgi:anti-sigma B factor antagonist